MVAPEEASPSKGKVFAQRLGSTSFLYGVLMIGLFSSSRQLSLIAFGGIITLLGVLALMELYGMAEKRGLKPFRGLGIAIGVALTGSAFWALGIHGQPDLALDIEIAILLCAVPVLGVAQIRRYTNEDKSSLAPLAATVFGIIYVAMLLNVLQKIRYFPDLEGHWWLMFFIVVSKMSDTGAYCTGQLIGRTKMIPRVSPGKTWEGFAGGIAFSVVAAWMFLHFAGEHFGAGPLAVLFLVGSLDALSSGGTAPHRQVPLEPQNWSRRVNNYLRRRRASRSARSPWGRRRRRRRLRRWR